MNEALRRLWLTPIARLGNGYWLAIVFLPAVVIFSPAALRADTPLVSGDTLTGAPCTACSAGVTRTNEGGSFTPEGWSQNVEDSRIIYDLGRGVACARITFEVAGWDPNQNMVGLTNEDNYHDDFGVFEGNHGDPELARVNRETSIIIQTVAAPDKICPSGQDGHHCRNIKLLGWAVPLSESFGNCPECDMPWCAPCGAFSWTDTDTNWSIDKRYSFEITWSHEGASLTVSEMGSDPVIRQASMGWLDSNPMRYFFLGGDKVSNGKNITGPVYTNVQVWEDSACANPCQGHCSNGVQDCVEKDVDCGGRCNNCADPDAGVPDTGFDAGNRPDTSVNDAGAPGDAQVTTDAKTPDDTGTVKPDAGTPADSGVSDAGKSSDGGTATDAGNGRAPSEETAGCSCATLSF